MITCILILYTYIPGIMSGKYGRSVGGQHLSKYHLGEREHVPYGLI